MFMPVRPLEGLEFYLKNEKDPIPYLMPMALKTWIKVTRKKQREILRAAQKLIDKNNWFKYQEELFHTYLDFYRHYKRFRITRNLGQLVTYYRKAEECNRLLN